MKWYHVVLVLRNEEKMWSEEMKNMSLSDFEVVYGNITDEIMSIIIMQQKEYVE